MRIVTLGSTSVGKTTYMASLYGALQQNVQGFSLGTSDRTVHYDLLGHARNIRNGRYPPPTAHRNEYVFSLCYNNATPIKFVWADYSGGALNELKTNEQAQKLQEELAEAIGMLLLIDGEVLAAGALRTSQIGRANALISQCANAVARPISLAVVLTKSDLVARYTADMLRPFEGLFTAVGASEHVFGSLFPVACGTNMRNVDKPLFSALWMAAMYQAAFLTFEINQHEERAASLQRDSEGVIGAVDWVFSRMLGLQTNGDMAREQRSQAQIKLQEYEKIGTTAAAIANQFAAYTVIESPVDLDQYAWRLNELR